MPAASSGGGARAFVGQHSHVFQASVRSARPSPQRDSIGDGVEQTPASEPDTRVPRATPAPTRGDAREPKEGETFHFSDIPPVDAAPLEDSITSNLTYTSPVRNVTPPSTPGSFGLTSPHIAVNRSTATYANRVYSVELVVDNKIDYWVHGGGRTNIASDSDPSITQTTYPTVVSDLTPSPAAVRNATANLYKNQPPRTTYWAEDLTLKHERFHAAEDVRFGRQGAAIGRDWLNTQTANSYDDIATLLHAVAVKVAAKIDLEMAVPGSEQRAYDDGAADYTSRATAIKTKGDARGYAPQPPAQQPSNPPQQQPNSPPQTPNSPPQSPGSPPSSAPRAPAAPGGRTGAEPPPG